MHKRGFVLTNAALEMESDYAFFCDGLKFLQSYEIDTVEFFCSPEDAIRYGHAVKNHGFEPVYLTALAQKRSGFCRLCAEDESVRCASVEFTKKSIDAAISTGALRLVMQSGVMPFVPARECDCIWALKRSLEELSEYAGDRILLSLEPCDRSVDTMQLIGPSMQAYTLMKNLETAYSNVELTMDVAHITELAENPVDAIALCRPYSSHIHLANCVLKYGTSQFGDKHPVYGVEDGYYTSEDAAAMYKKLEGIYEGKNLLVSMEMIHSGVRSMDFIQSVLNAAPWFYRKR